MRLHGTTQFVSDMPVAARWSLGNRCPHCNVQITNHATLCKPCNRRIQENRKRFAKRAATLSRADVLALTATQMASARAKLDVGVGMAGK